MNSFGKYRKSRRRNLSRRRNSKSCGCRRKVKCEKHKRKSNRTSSGRKSIRDWIGFKEYMHNGMSSRSFTMLPRTKKLQIIKEALRVVKHSKARKNIQADLKYIKQLG